MDPWASVDEIRRAVRRKLREVHPDGPSPNPVLYRRYLIIRDVLLSPVRKMDYDRTGPGQVYIDDQLREDLERRGVPPESFEDIPVAPSPELRSGYDFFSIGVSPQDAELADSWYDHLVAVAPLFAFRRPLRLLLSDGVAPDWKHRGGIIVIPRRWVPSRSAAFGIFSCVIAPRSRSFL